MRAKSNPTQTQTQRVDNSSQMKLWKRVFKPSAYGVNTQLDSNDSWLLSDGFAFCPKGTRAMQGQGITREAPKAFPLAGGVCISPPFGLRSPS